MEKGCIRTVSNWRGLLPDSSQSRFLPRVLDGLLDTDIAPFRRAIKSMSRRKSDTHSTSCTRIKRSFIASKLKFCVIVEILPILNGSMKIHASSYLSLVFSF
jgi:hypothetical protein